MGKYYDKKDIEELLKNFLLDISDAGLIGNSSFDFEKISKRYAKKVLKKPGKKYIEEHLD